MARLYLETAMLVAIGPDKRLILVYQQILEQTLVFEAEMGIIAVENFEKFHFFP